MVVVVAAVAFEHLSYFSKGKCARQQPLALSQRTRPPLSRLVALLARGNTRNTPDTSPFPRWKWVAFFLPFLYFCPFCPSPRCPPAGGGEAGAGPACGFVGRLLCLWSMVAAATQGRQAGALRKSSCRCYYFGLQFRLQWCFAAGDMVSQLAGLGAPAWGGPWGP